MIPLEITLRIPNVSVHTGNAPVRRITNSETRFSKLITVPTLPKVGDLLELSSRAHVFAVTVKRLEWRDQDNRFVAACEYAKRSMSQDEYDDLRADPEWTMKPLL